MFEADLLPQPAFHLISLCRSDVEDKHAKSSPLGVATARCAYIRVGALDWHRAFAESTISMTTAVPPVCLNAVYKPRSHMRHSSANPVGLNTDCLRAVRCVRAVHKFGSGAAPARLVPPKYEVANDDGAAWMGCLFRHTYTLHLH